MIIKADNSVSNELIKIFSEMLRISEDFAYLLIKRGINTVPLALEYLYPDVKNLTDPFLYSGMKEAAEKVKEHCLAGTHRIVVYGDYDCDGISAVTILLRAFRGKGIAVDYYIPTRREEGYGLNIDAINKINAQFHPNLLITVDCGITSYAEIKYAKSLGMDVIVTDHHTLSGRVPDCIVVDPCLNPELTQLCGAGVAFTLVRGMFGTDYAMRFVDICALATIADIVPLVGDNRIIATYGINAIRSGRGKTGITELIRQVGIERRRVNSTDIGFKIAPRLNAAGRLNVAHTSVGLLLTNDPTEAAFLAEELSLQNSERQELCKSIYQDALQRLLDYDFFTNKVIVLKGDDWNEGVIGIVAAKIAEYFYMPTILLTKGTDGKLKGSARSINGINIVELIGSQDRFLSGFGGHAMAAGLSMPEDNFDSFFEGINNEIKELPVELFARKTNYDAEISLNKITYNFIKELERMEPYGYKNQAPLFCDNDPEIIFARIGTTEHIKAQTLFGEVVSFYKYAELPAYATARNKRLVFTLSKNYFNGKEYEQARVKKMDYSHFSVAIDTLESRFAIFSNRAKHTNREGKHPKKGASLDVFFDNKLFAEYTERNSDIRQLFGGCDEYEYTATAVLSPETDFPFGYYGKIRVHGKITDDMKKFFTALGAEFIDADNGCFECSRYSIDEMRKLFVTLRSNNGNKFCTVFDLYSRIKGSIPDICYEKFVVYFCILNDVRLIKIDGDGILIVINQKTDLNSSSLYRYIYG